MAGNRVVGSMLFEVSSDDPLTIAVAAVGLAVMATRVGLLPARCATRGFGGVELGPATARMPRPCNGPPASAYSLPVMRTLDFGGLFERHWPDVFRFALYLTGNRADAEDVASETFARAWTAPGEIRVGTVKAYLFMIARNLTIDLRRAAREVVECGPHVPASVAGPERATIDWDELRVVLAALAELPENDRAALLMRAVGQLSYEEIAATLGLSVGATRVRIHRARTRLAASASRRRTQP